MVNDQIKAVRFYENLKLILSTLDWSMADLARAAHTSRQNVCNYAHRINKPNITAYFAFRYVIEQENKLRPETREKTEFILANFVDNA